MNKILIVIFVLFGGLMLFVLLSDGGGEPTASINEPMQSQSSSDEQPADTSADTATENYVDYSPEALANSEADTNILFFHAVWCTICNSVERSITAGSIPDDVKIFKIDFDSPQGQELAEQYDIPIQYTSVQVDRNGTELTQWVNQFNDGVGEFLERTVAS